MRSHQRSIVLALALLGCGLALAPARNAEASAFRVTPIRVNFNSRTTSALMTLINESQDELRFQVSVFEWQQKDQTGEMDLTPTRDIVFFPSLLTLKPGEERKVRVGTTKKSGAVEKTYRIFFEELPPLETPETQGAQVRIITKLGVPVFIDPDKVAASGDVANIALADGKLVFDVTNSGNVHFLTRGVRVTGLASDGKPVFQKQREGWYVLRQGFRRYDLELTKTECAQATTVRIEVDTDMPVAKSASATLSHEYTIPTGACGK